MILGVDLSLTSTGLSDGTLTMRVKTAPSDLMLPRTDLQRRIEIILEGIDSYLRGHAGDANNWIYVEGPAYGVSPERGSHLFEYGWLFGCMWERFCAHAAIMEVAPAVLKKYIGGKGNLPKDQVPLAVYKKFGIEFEDDPGKDKAHAYALYRLGVDHRNGIIDINTTARRGTRKASKVRAAKARAARDIQAEV